MKELQIMQSMTDRTMPVEEYLKDISRIPLLTPEEETELATRIQQGDEEAFEKLVVSNLRFSVSVAKQYQGNGLELADLIAEANIGLMRSARKFDPTRGFKFISYAVYWIRQQIMQYISESGRMIRLPLNQVGVLNRINKAKIALAQKLERDPSDKELAQYLEMPLDKIKEALAASPRHLSYDMPFGDDEEGSLLDIVPDTSLPKADEGLEKDSLKSDISDALTILSPREREIISLCYGLGCSEMSLEEIGDRYELTRERVRQVREKALRKLSRSSYKKRLAQYV